MMLGDFLGMNSQGFDFKKIGREGASSFFQWKKRTIGGFFFFFFNHGLNMNNVFRYTGHSGQFTATFFVYVHLLEKILLTLNLKN